jgi:hypothetical protein
VLVRCLRRVPTEEWYSSEARVFATKGIGLEKTSFGDGASLLGSLDAAVNTDAIVLDWGLPKISSIDLLVKPRWNSPGLARFSRGARYVRQEREFSPRGDCHEMRYVSFVVAIAGLLTRRPCSDPFGPNLFYLPFRASRRPSSVNAALRSNGLPPTP